MAKKFPPQVARLVHEYVNDRLPAHVRAAHHVSSTTGKVETIEEMAPTHAKNALAKIRHELAAGKMAYMDEHGVIKYI